MYIFRTRPQFSVGDIPLNSRVRIIKTDFKSDKNRHRVVMIECLFKSCKHRRLVRSAEFEKQSKPYANGCRRCHLKADYAMKKELSTRLCKQYNLTRQDYENIDSTKLFNK